jgi:hypothetical protein
LCQNQTFCRLSARRLGPQGALPVVLCDLS